MMFFDHNRARERTPIHKATGVTPSERYLNNLCENSFLSLWSYPGIFRDQKNKGKGDGKELCDMLVVFDDNVLIFSDKHCSFPSTGDLELDWKRWYKKTIQKSGDQAWGAERWIRQNPQRIYLDRACTKPFPLKIPSSEVVNFHLIVVAHGSEDRCRIEFGGSGSLMFSSSLGQNADKEALCSTPFMVGDLDPNRTFIHVLTESTLDILLQTLDTISDFVWYLEKKVKFVRSMLIVSSPGEEELLAFYLAKLNKEGEHDFVIGEDVNGFGLEEGFWEDFCKSSERQAQLQQNEISYLWDDLIERFSHHALNATQYFSNHTELSETEIGLRLMAREPRTVRRLIMRELIELYFNTPDGMKRVKFFPPISPGSPFYVFLSLPKPDYTSYEEYRIARGNLLEAHLWVVKYEFPEAMDIVGIASEPMRAAGGSSEDLLYLDAREWSDEMDIRAAELKEDLGIFKSATTFHVHGNEYPV